MHREVVEERSWLSEKQFMNALSFCMLLPGPEAMQLATFAGWRLHGTLGGLVAGLLFVVPGACVILALASIYAAFGDVPFVSALFLGVKAAVVIIVIEALLRVAKKALQHKGHWVIAALAFVGIYILALPYPLIIATAALYGFLHARRSDEAILAPPTVLQPFSTTIQTIALWSVIWFAPLLALMTVAPEGLLTGLFVFFSKLAIVTFGGAYAVLAYMAQEVVGTKRLAHRAGNDGRAWLGRDHAGAPHSGHPVCRLHRRAKAIWLWHGSGGQRSHPLGNLRALLPLDLCGRTLH